jgi:heavy metal translocating P-type ATPase
MKVASASGAASTVDETARQERHAFSPGIGRKNPAIAAVALAGIAVHLVLKYVAGLQLESWQGVPASTIPLWIVLIVGGLPQVVELAAKALRREFGSDLLAGMSIVTSVVLGEYLAGALVVLMLSGGASLEAYAVRSASSVLDALANRMPSVAHRRFDGQLFDVGLTEVAVGDVLVVFPHEYCPVDGTVIEGHGIMDESYLTGEPYRISKAPGAGVLSGAINGDSALTIRAEKLAVDSRYARIMQVMRSSEQRRPRLRRLADQLGAWYTPLALTIAAAAWLASGSATRFLAVLVVATPCPLLIAIPVAIIGAVSLSARRGIIIKDPAVLERIDQCRTAIFDKTGTLTYGEPRLSELLPAPGHSDEEVLQWVASVERYSKHPLSAAILAAAQSRRLALHEVAEVSERPGEGLRALVAGRRVQITSRKRLLVEIPGASEQLPPAAGGLECVVLIDDRYAGVLRFRDEPRSEGAHFVKHLGPKHHFDRVMLVSGDRESEVRYLAEQVGIDEVHFSQSPEQKLELVRRETARAPTVFMGDGINDAPALTASTVGIAFGQNSEITSEAAGAVILDSSLERVDEFLHISHRMRTIALESAVGGMALSMGGMLLAAAGLLSPVAGAIAQEVIDVVAVLNALRVAIPPRELTDYE